METTQTTKNYTGHRLTRPKKSILRRWTFANALFFLVAFTAFAAVTYALTVNAMIGGQKTTIQSVMNQVTEKLEQSDKPLTAENLRSVFEYRASTTSGTIETSELMNLLIQSRNQLFIYNTDRQMIFSTAGNSDLTIDDTKGQIKTVNTQGYEGYLLSKPIISQKTGKVVAYAQTFFSLKAYYEIRNRLFLFLLSIAVIAIAGSAIFAYFNVKRDLKPLKQITDSMENVAANPEEIFEPVSINREDEVGQIADFYNAMMARLMANMEHQKSFVSDVAHELRTPIAVIDGNLKMLMRWGKDDPEMLAETLEITQHEATRMSEMIGDMLELSRLETLPEENRTATCDVLKACSDVTRNFKLIHEDFDINFLSNLTELERAQIAEKHYTQALTILMDNAVKYTADGEKRIELSVKSDKDYIITSVQDHGVGISEEEAQHVFERFFRADKARNRDIGGSGLGLSIINNILKFYQGEITLVSKPGEGSTFTFKIPKAKSMS
ncbi:MAG: HAMP domain-containing histidine kinase [Streptococcaceae bacterium]|jgi:signal transduction histidine kinase|nr:HAMP domain-containing histidine kinase [Streptococcaceae bacterium]